MRDGGEAGRVFDAAEEVWLLDDDAGGVFVDGGGQVLWFYDAVGCADGDQFDAEVFQIRGDRLAIFGMHAGGGDDFAVSLRAADGHEHGLGGVALPPS